MRASHPSNDHFIIAMSKLKENQFQRRWIYPISKKSDFKIYKDNRKHKGSERQRKNVVSVMSFSMGLSPPLPLVLLYLPFETHHRFSGHPC
jgi:hypothetical protein